MENSYFNQFDLLKNLPKDEFYVIKNGKLVENFEDLKSDDVFHVIPRVLGGKGGFGSLLRSFGSQFYKSTNHDMCRDLSGRRLKDVKEEEKLQKYIAGIESRNKEKAKKLEEKYEKLKDFQFRAEKFTDEEYFKTKQKLVEEAEDAVLEGLKVSTANGSGAVEKLSIEKDEDEDKPTTSKAAMVTFSESDQSTSKISRKRPFDISKSSKEKSVIQKKKPKGDLWFGVELNSDDEDSLSEDDNDKPNTKVDNALVAA